MAYKFKVLKVGGLYPPTPPPPLPSTMWLASAYVVSPSGQELVEIVVTLVLLK